jgi:hypothetical protein
MNLPPVIPPIIGQTPAPAFTLSGEPLAALRSPGLFSDAAAGVLFESHWLWWLALAAVAAALYYVGRSRVQQPLAQTGMALGGLTAAWILLALVFASPGERLYAALRGLADASAARDVDRMLAYLSKDFRAPVLDMTGDVPPKEKIAYYINTYGIRETYITAYRFNRLGANALTNVTLLTTTSNGTIKTSWELSWDDVPGEDWRIVRARLTKLGDQSVDRDVVIP